MVPWKSILLALLKRNKLNTLYPIDLIKNLKTKILIVHREIKLYSTYTWEIRMEMMKYKNYAKINFYFSMCNQCHCCYIKCIKHIKLNLIVGHYTVDFFKVLHSFTNHCNSIVDFFLLDLLSNSLSNAKWNFDFSIENKLCFTKLNAYIVQENPFLFIYSKEYMYSHFYIIECEECYGNFKS